MVKERERDRVRLLEEILFVCLFVDLLKIINLENEHIIN